MRFIGQFVGGARVLRLGQKRTSADRINETGHVGFRVTQTFHSAHDGIDLGNYECGDRLYAPADGYVVNRKDPAGALIVEVHEADGWVTSLAHLSRFAKASGNRVRRGEVIGYVGATGKVTGGCHIHMSRRSQNGPAVDPWPRMEQNRPARINGSGINIRNSPSLSGRVHGTTSASKYRDAYVSGWHWKTGGTHGIRTASDPNGNQWRKLWIDGAYRYVARPLVVLL